MSQRLQVGTQAARFQIECLLTGPAQNQMDLQTFAAAQPLQQPQRVNCPTCSGNPDNNLQTLLLFLASGRARTGNCPPTHPPNLFHFRNIPTVIS